jgi:hypothetical protein
VSQSQAKLGNLSGSGHILASFSARDLSKKRFEALD